MALRFRTTWLPAAALAAACASDPDKQTLARLHAVEPDVTEVKVDNSLDKAMGGYRKFLEEAPESALTPEAMRRLADLELEKEYGILGDGQIQEMAAPEPAPAEAKPKRARTDGKTGPSESDQEFERRATRADGSLASGEKVDLQLPNGKPAEPQGPLQAIALYDQILKTYPN